MTRSPPPVTQLTSSSDSAHHQQWLSSPPPVTQLTTGSDSAHHRQWLRNDGEWGLHPSVEDLLAEKVKKFSLRVLIPRLYTYDIDFRAQYRSPSNSQIGVTSTSGIGTLFSLQVTCLFGSVGSTLADPTRNEHFSSNLDFWRVGSNPTLRHF